MTTIAQLTILSAAQLRRRDAIAALATIAMLASLAHLWHTATAQAVDTQGAKMERVMLAACRLPDTDGAYTWFRRVDGKFECGRYR